MASEFKTNYIKYYCGKYGEDNIMGFIIDTQEHFMMMPGQVFNYNKMVSENSNTLQMKVPCGTYDKDGKPLMYVVNIPLMLIHSILIKAESGQYLVHQLI